MTKEGASAAKGRSIKTLRPSRAERRTRPTTDDHRAGYVEILPGIWQPTGMAEAERWKRQQLRRGQQR